MRDDYEYATSETRGGVALEDIRNVFVDARRPIMMDCRVQ